MHFVTSLSTKQLLIALFLLLTASIGQGQNKHNNWDLGIGLTAYSIPDYYGSKHSTRIFSPFPYIVYQGEYLSLKNGRVSGTLFSSTRWNLSLSADGSPPIKSDKNNARANMPDLDFVGEIGPAIEYYFLDHETKYRKLFLEIPLRNGITTDLKRAQSIGWISNPRVKYHFRLNQWKLRIGLGPSFATKRFYNHYYGVDEAFQTPSRDTYASSGGYGGMRYSFGFSRVFGEFSFGGYLRWIDLSGAAFRQSPLLEDNNSLLAGVSLSWIFY